MFYNPGFTLFGQFWLCNHIFILIKPSVLLPVMTKILISCLVIVLNELFEIQPWNLATGTYKLPDTVVTHQPLTRCLWWLPLVLSSFPCFTESLYLVKLSPPVCTSGCGRCICDLYLAQSSLFSLQWCVCAFLFCQWYNMAGILSECDYWVASKRSALKTLLTWVRQFMLIAETLFTLLQNITLLTNKLRGKCHHNRELFWLANELFTQFRIYWQL